MKKIMFFLVLFIGFSLYSQTAVAPAIGDGTEGNPFQIATLDNLYWITQNNDSWDKYFIQTADIDASATLTWFPDGAGGYFGWLPIGTNAIRFSGSYNGCNYSVNNLFINRLLVSYAGLFGDTFGTSISNLSVLNANVTANYYVGIIAGKLNLQMTNCHSSGSATANSYVGGLVGMSFSGTILNCTSSAQVTSTGNNDAGGIVGSNHKGMIDGCSSTGDVAGNYEVGGLAGLNYSAAILNSFSTGSVTALGDYSGGFVGNNYYSVAHGTLSLIDNCYTSALSVEGENYVGGFVGYNMNDITNSYYD